MHTIQIGERWSLNSEHTIKWDIKPDNRLPHHDHIEMSGKRISMIVHYGIDHQGELVLKRGIIWPMLRTIPNDTHASLIQEYGAEIIPEFTINGERVQSEKPYEVTFNGMLAIKSRTDNNLRIEHVLFPTTDYSAAMEKYTVVNESEQSMTIEIAPLTNTITRRGVYGIYVLDVSHDAPSKVTLQPAEKLSFYLTISGRKLLESVPVCSGEEEEAKRAAFVSRIRSSLQLETPDPVLNQMFDFAKLRASESIFATKGGLMHGPGGGNYYAAIWANDQAEYVGPFFPYLGDSAAIEASLNCYRLYRAFMGPDYSPIPSSIIAEGVDIWEGAGDRGDAAMYAYGASLFTLAQGDSSIAQELWPAIQWCLEYCKRKLTTDGVVASDSDELEGRFPTGQANLSTSSLYYGALCAASKLARSLSDETIEEQYSSEAVQLRQAIERYFGATVDGYETYRYYEGNDKLRSWICLPLTMGIMDRQEGTVNALYSPNLWTIDGLATQSGDKTFWDRSTLYGFQATFMAGEVEQSHQYLKAYSRRRLLGDHVPYAVEAFPEGNQRHLSAESALYCRIFTEGVFGIKPTGLDSFTCAPQLPAEGPTMNLRSIRAFGRNFDLHVSRMDNRLHIQVDVHGAALTYECLPGEKIEVVFPARTLGISTDFHHQRCASIHIIGEASEVPS
ncbi:hypothetical protein [Paenibacillus sp. CF384]|uniref:hypothetical protein n=1 Tax=Paenibacillus sp. CF384 TaxID=1884382 RepID=UPI00089D7FDD|nr:hypothetical protein [Paenibacillus sp. CF384]SDX73599.1 hypothetical protein SAMN05518855_10201 [Paenibacillus sp. CF384]